MKTLFSAYQSDATLEKDGVWKDFPEAGVRVLIARAGGRNTPFSAAQAEALSDKFEDLGKMEPEAFRNLMAPVFASTVVKKIEGEGFKDEEGKDLPQTPEVYAEVLTALPDFFEEIQYFASQRTNYRKAKDEAIAGN